MRYYYCTFVVSLGYKYQYQRGLVSYNLQTIVIRVPNANYGPNPKHLCSVMGKILKKFEVHFFFFFLVMRIEPTQLMFGPMTCA